MGSEHKLSKRKDEDVYRFQIGSKYIFNDLENIGFIPNKIKRMVLPKMSNKFSSDFVRGYFDGDGNVWSGIINRSRVKPTNVLQVAFTSGCESFLKDLLDLFRKYAINGGSLFKVKNKNCSRLLFGTSDSLKIYEIMYNRAHELHLARKKQVFDRFIKMRP
jgi:intein/homing endonuclease